MSKIRNVFRASLDARAPTSREAREDFDRILDRTSRARERTVFRIAPLLGAASLSMAAAAALILRPGPTIHDSRTPSVLAHPEGSAAPDASAESVVTVYVRRANEPESAAMSVTLNVRKGI